MKVSKNMTTEQVKSRFHNRYPKLKIEFYNMEHEAFAISSNCNKITEDVPLRSLNPKMKNGELSLYDSLKVRELEKLMKDNFGLNIQVFRKSGNQWMQTSITDNWTLGKQEEKGELLDKFLNS